MDCFSEGVMLISTATESWDILFLNDAWMRITGVHMPAHATGTHIPHAAATCNGTILHATAYGHDPIGHDHQCCLAVFSSDSRSTGNACPMTRCKDIHGMQRN